jgi:hypothetical protein
VYRFNRRVARKKKRYAFLKFLWKFLLFALVAGLIIWFLLKPHTHINNGNTVLVPTASDAPALRHITEPYYSFDFPADWKELARQIKPLNFTTWKGTTKESTARTLDIYTDTIPTTLAVNRILPVSSQDDRLGVGVPSQNCIYFSPDTASLTPVAAAKLKVIPVTFQKVPFLCDIPNSLRNLIGASSSEGLNRVSLTGVKGGKHTYFFMYNDGSAHPEDHTFPAILSSFRAL